MFQDLARIFSSTSRAGIRRRILESASMAHDIVSDNQRTGTAQGESPLQIARVIDLVGIDKDQIKRGLRLSVNGKAKNELSFIRDKPHLPLASVCILRAYETR